MKKLTALILLLSFINCYAEDKIFLSCRGTLTNKITKNEFQKPDYYSTITNDVITEVVIDFTSNSMKVQLPILNMCYGRDKCDCKFSIDSFECKESSKQEYASGAHTSYQKLEISRKTGFAIFTGLYSTTISSSQFVSLSMNEYNGQMQCTTMTKNIF